jgi:hypothetical protein
MKHLIQALTRHRHGVDQAVALIVGGLLVVVASQVIDRHFIDLWRDSPEGTSRSGSSAHLHRLRAGHEAPRSAST